MQNCITVKIIRSGVFESVCPRSPHWVTVNKNKGCEACTVRSCHTGLREIQGVQGLGCPAITLQNQEIKSVL